MSLEHDIIRVPLCKATNSVPIVGKMYQYFVEDNCRGCENLHGVYNGLHWPPSDDVTVLALCEYNMIIQRANVLYRYEIGDNCDTCKKVDLARGRVKDAWSNKTWKKEE